MHVLLNWLMQGTLVGLAAAAGLRVLPASHAEARGRFLVGAYLLVLGLPMIPAATAALAAHLPPVDLAQAAAPTITIAAGWWSSAMTAFGLWTCWALLLAIQFLAAAARIRRAKRRAAACPREILDRLPCFSQLQKTGRAARVVISADVPAAAVLGCGSPVIALAPALVERLGADDLDRILVHEWAHVQRRDDVAQMIQRIARAIVGWHPAAWWLERHIDLERESACDRVVVRATGSAKAYAACLVTVAGLPRAAVRSMPLLAAAAPSLLRTRVVRLLAPPCDSAARRWWTAATCACGAALVASAIGAGSVRVAVAEAAAIAALPAPIANVAARFHPSAAIPAANESAPPESRAARVHPRTFDGTVTSPHHANPSPDAAAVSDRPAGGTAPASASAQLPAAESPLAARALTGGSLVLPRDASAASDSAADPNPAVWTQAADGGIAIGRAYQSAGTATAGFFSRFGRKLARSF